jgi:hypothetical protein
MNPQTETRLEAEQAKDPGEGLGSFGLAHLAACCVGGGAAVLAIILVEWLS